MKQCFIFDNDSNLFSNLVNRTKEKLSAIVFNSQDIAKEISGLDPNWAHGHDMITSHMLTICGESIHKILEFIFTASLNDERLPSQALEKGGQGTVTNNSYQQHSFCKNK